MEKVPPPVSPRKKEKEKVEVYVTKPPVVKVSYFSLSQLKHWGNDQLKRWMISSTGGRLDPKSLHKVVIARASSRQAPGEWLASMSRDLAVRSGIPDTGLANFVVAAIRFRNRCAAVSIERAFRRYVAREEGKKLMEEARKRQRHRELTAKEILSTEETYLEQLDILCDLMWAPLNADQKKREKVGLSADDFKAVFTDVEIIRGVNRSLYALLKERMEHWSPAQVIGDVFVKMSDYLRVYVDYIKGYAHAAEIVSKFRLSHPFRKFFAEQIKKAPASYANFDFESLLIVPVQRIPRYKLLVADFLKYTPEGHPDFENLTIALQKLTAIAAWVNENQHRAEMMAKTVELSESVVGMDEKLITASRVFIKDGDLVEYVEGKLVKRVLMLFSDIVVVCEGKKIKKEGSIFSKKRTTHAKMQFSRKLRLETLNVESVASLSEETSKFCFRLFKDTDKEGGYIYCVDTEDERQQWVEKLTDAITAARELKQQQDAERDRAAASRAEQAKALLSQQYAAIKLTNMTEESAEQGKEVDNSGDEKEDDDTPVTPTSASLTLRRAKGKSGTISRKKYPLTWFSMSAMDKMKLAEEAKAGLEELQKLTLKAEAEAKMREEERERKMAEALKKSKEEGESETGTHKKKKDKKDKKDKKKDKKKDSTDRSDKSGDSRDRAESSEDADLYSAFSGDITPSEIGDDTRFFDDSEEEEELVDIKP